MLLRKTPLSKKLTSEDIESRLKDVVGAVMYTCVYVCVCTCLYVFVYVFVLMCMCVCVCHTVYVCVHAFICVL